MAWWGKAAGGAVGFAVFGPVGAIVGAAIGHEFDKGLDEELHRAAPRGGSDGAYPLREVLFGSTFPVMGYIAHCDGRTSSAEVAVAGAIMAEMNLSPERCREAMRLFESGRARGFPLDRHLERLREVGRERPELLRAFLELQLRVASADGIDAAKRKVLWRVCRQLGISRIELAQLETIARLRRGRTGAAQWAAAPDEAASAFEVLGVDADASDDEVKKAYRRLMNRHHPDKLAGTDATEEDLARARDRTREIRAAYESVVAARRDRAAS